MTPAAEAADPVLDLPPGIGDPGPTAWHRLDPLTRLTVSLATVVAVVVWGGVLGPTLLVSIAVLVPAWLAGVLAPVLRTSLLLALPLAVSATLINILLLPGGAVLAEVGPFTLTGEGVRLAAEVVVRVVAMAGAVTLFYQTVTPAGLVASLQAHGLGPRWTFVIHNAVAMIPRLAERAQEVTAAQRSRGLDTEGNILRRSRGLAAVAIPTVLGAIAEVEQRTLALETRGFSRPGRRDLLMVPADSASQRLARWGLLVGVVLLMLARLAGVRPPF